MKEKTMKETTNGVYITGLLVKKEFEIKDVSVKDANGNVVGQDKAISGSLILRTADGSEHDVSYYSRMTKKDGSSNGIFKSLETVRDEYKALEQFPNEADHVKIGAGQFSVNDYKNKDGDVKTYIQTKANFANRLSQKEIETTPLEARFEIEGIINSVEPEVFKNEPTGNFRVVVNVLGYNGTIIPVTVVVLKEMADAFANAGFFEGGFAKFTGKLVNTKETVEIVEKMAFGQDNIRVVDKTVSRFEVTGGNPMGMPIEQGIEDAEYEQAKAKRKLKLQEIKNKENTPSQAASSANPFGSGTNSPPPAGNPFANPFAK